MNDPDDLFGGLPAVAKADDDLFGGLPVAKAENAPTKTGTTPSASAAIVNTVKNNHQPKPANYVAEENSSLKRRGVSLVSSIGTAGTAMVSVWHVHHCGCK